MKPRIFNLQTIKAVTFSKEIIKSSHPLNNRFSWRRLHPIGVVSRTSSEEERLSEARNPLPPPLLETKEDRETWMIRVVNGGWSLRCEWWLSSTAITCSSRVFATCWWSSSIDSLGRWCCQLLGYSWVASCIRLIEMCLYSPLPRKNSSSTTSNKLQFFSPSISRNPSPICMSSVLKASIISSSETSPAHTSQD